MQDTKEKIRAYKEHKFIIFEFEDGKTVKYDLSNGETIGKLGKPVKSLNAQLSGHNVYDVIDCFDDENYKAFMRFVLKYFINDCRDKKYGRDGEVDRVKNVGTFLSRLCFFSHFEQYFAAGICNINKSLTHRLSEIPKQLLKIAKQHNFTLCEQLISDYNRNPDLFVNVLNVECDSISFGEKYTHVLKIANERYPRLPVFYTLIRDYNYNPVALIKYIDYLITYEALTLNDAFSELQDYCSMMSVISPKYDKYPRNFLTTHRIASRNYERLKTQYPEEAFTCQRDTALEWSKEDYKVIYPSEIQDIRDEAVQQNNCVSSYIKNVIEGKCHIVFLRDKSNVDNSLVTMEIRDNRVVQAKGKFNRDVTVKEQYIIEKYNSYLSKKNSAYPICNTEEATVC